MRLGTQTFTGPAQSYGFVIINEVFTGGDRLIIGGAFQSPTKEPLGFRLEGFDPSGTLFSSDAWPTDVAGTLNAAPQRLFALWVFLGEPDGVFPIASGTPVTIRQEPGVPVPEPTSLLLVGTGLVGVISARRWRQKA